MPINYGEFERDMSRPWDPEQLKKLQRDLDSRWGQETYSPDERRQLKSILSKVISKREREIKSNVSRVDDRKVNPGKPQGGKYGGVTLTGLARWATGKPKPPGGGTGKKKR